MRKRLLDRFDFWGTLRFRFAMWVAGFLLTLLIIFGVFIYFKLAYTLYSVTDTTLRVNATQEIAMIDADVRPELNEQGLTVRYLSTGGEIIQAYGGFSDLPLDATVFEQALQGREHFATVYELHDDDRVRIYTTPVIQDGNVTGVIQTMQSLVKVDETLEQLFTTLSIGVPLLSILAGVGSYLLAARALARIDQITRTVRMISAKDLATRLNLRPRDDEVGRLATTFDEMLARLDESFERERRFTADASHELRTPLAAIQVIIEAMLEHRRSAEEYEQALLDISDETNRLGAVAEDLLALVRGRERQQPLYEQVDLSLLLHDVTDSMLPLAEAKGLSITCNVAAPLELYGDTDGLIRLLINMLDNAIKYTDTGTITVQAQRETNGMVRVTVTDTGCGIEAEKLPHIFEPFYRVDTSRTTRGAGLGLAIAREIAQVHNGTITVTSTVGAGSTFTILLGSPERPPNPESG